MQDLREKRVELILQQLEELPTLPAIAVRVLEATGDNASSAREIVNLIESDPALTARILQLARRAALGASMETASLERAVSLLGFDAIKNAVLAVSIFQTFGLRSEADTGQFSRDEFWKHCLGVACCAELLAGAAAPAATEESGEAFICGLLHDLGKIALDAVLPKSFSRVVEAADLLRGNIADLERSVIGLDHMVAGKRLAERWQLPPVVRDCIWLHGQLPQALPSSLKNPRLVNLVTLADQLVREQHLGYSGNYSLLIPRQTLLQAVGLSEEQVAEVMTRLVEQIEPRASALGLGTTSSNELYQQALARANTELGRASVQLAAKNRRLAVRAKFFDALSRFHSELRPDSPAQLVLQAIAQTAVGVLGVPVAAAFSLPPGRNYAELVLCDANGEIFDNSLIDLLPIPGAESVAASGAPVAARPNHPGAGDGPVMPCGADLEWLTSAISPRLPHDRRFWICLEADGDCVGGVVWGGATGDPHRLGPQVQEIAAIANGWSLALRTSQIREEARSLSEQLAEVNRQLQSAQSEILRSRTMISVGEMAAGAAHEMNNPLAVISGRSQLLASQLSDPKYKAAAHLIHEQAHRLSAIITELMDFAKPEAPLPAQVDVAELLERALHEAKMHNDPADRDIEVTMGDVPLVLADARQVTAAMTEIIDNALHATDADKGHIAIHAAHDPSASRVVVTITDDGCGMDDRTVKRAFDPFFSNKPAGRRRGLGLAKALRWVEASGGAIRLESRPGQGTRCVILLPAAGVIDVPAPAEGRRAENF